MKTLILTSILALTLTSCSSTSTTESTSEYVDNAAITTKVKSKLVSNDIMSASNIEVESYKGTVILAGFVKTEEEKEKALDIAEKTKGVNEVKDALFLRKDIESKMSE